jgi:hypothetical protein
LSSACTKKAPATNTAAETSREKDLMNVFTGCLHGQNDTPEDYSPVLIGKTVTRCRSVASRRT